MNRSQQIQLKELFNFSKHYKNNSLIKIAVSPRFESENKHNYTKTQYQQTKQISYKKNKQHKEVSMIPVKGHKRVASMFTGQRQKKLKLQRIQFDSKSPIEKYISNKDETPTFSFIQSSKKIDKHNETKQQELEKDLQIFPLSFKKKNNREQNNNRSIRKIQVNKYQLINEIIFFKNKLDGEIMKNKQLSNTYQEFLDENYQLKQLNLNHPNWYLFQENLQLKEKLRLIQEFRYVTQVPETPKGRKQQQIENLEFMPQSFNGTTHNSPIRQLYPFQ